MAKVKPRVKAPKKAKAGQVIQIKTLISHKMESGVRKDKKTGDIIPRQIINKFECMYNGKEAFSCDWFPAISANPFLSFNIKAGESGELLFKWYDDNGKTYEKKHKLTVS